MSRGALNVFGLLAAIAAAVYQFYLKDFLLVIGYNRVIESVGNNNCQKIPELQACEKIVIHQPSGHLYLACSELEYRVQWLPGAGRFDTRGASKDYIAVYDPETSKITKLKFSGVDDFGYSSQGMDVVPSKSNPSELFVYLTDHRPPVGKDAATVGADSVLHIFKHTLGGDKLTHVKTFEDPRIITPNDVVGSDDGQSLYFTNDHGEKLGFGRHLDIYLKRKSTSVVYCHIKEGCKYAIQHMHGNNGIVRASNGTFYVTNSLGGILNVLEQQSDNTLVVTDSIKADRCMDNLSIDAEGHVWAAGFPDALKLVNEHFVDPSLLAPASALRFSINTGPNAISGEKYKIEKVFEDDGHVTPGATSAAYDSQRRRLFLHGLCAPHLTVCKL